MSYKYNLITAALMFIICLTVVYFYMISHKKAEKIFFDQTYDMISDLKKTFLKDTVDNIINSIDIEVENEKRRYEKTAHEKFIDISSMSYLSEEEFSGYASKQLLIQNNSKCLSYFIWNKTSGAVVSCSENAFDKTGIYSIRELEEKFYSFESIDTPSLVILFGATKEYVDAIVKERIKSRIRNMTFKNDEYIWINEILNYNGGENYALRLVHPNLPETENMLLSTNMKDDRGNMPYLMELEGVRSNGQVFFTYYFKKPSSGTSSEKISYARLYKKYNWVIAMGTYTDDMHLYIEETDRKIRAISLNATLNTIWFLLAIVLVCLTLMVTINRYYFRRSKKALEKEVNSDILTRAYSRRFGINEMSRAFNDFRKYGINSGIMIFDIDHFKEVNDTYGHDAGDVVLKELTDSVLNCIRSSDRCIRWGGDEFICIFNNISPEDMKSFGHKILATASALNINAGNVKIFVSVSIGMSAFCETDNSYEDALKRADKALYNSKSNGRNKATIL